MHGTRGTARTFGGAAGRGRRARLLARYREDGFQVAEVASDARRMTVRLVRDLYIVTLFLDRDDAREILAVKAR